MARSLKCKQAYCMAKERLSENSPRERGKMGQGVSVRVPASVSFSPWRCGCHCQGWPWGLRACCCFDTLYYSCSVRSTSRFYRIPLHQSSRSVALWCERGKVCSSVHLCRSRRCEGDTTLLLSIQRSWLYLIPEAGLFADTSFPSGWQIQRLIEAKTKNVGSVHYCGWSVQKYEM